VAHLQRKIRVLVVEDEIVVSEDLQQRLVTLGFEVTGAADTASEAIRAATSTAPDVALMDIMLHGRPEGIDAAEHLRTKLDIPVIFLTAHSDSATLKRAKLTDPAGYIVKPFDDSQLRVALELAPVRHEMERKAQRVNRWMTSMLTFIGDGVIATNCRSEILFLNSAAEKLTGWTQDDAVGKRCSEVVRLVNRLTGQPLEDPATRALRHGLVIRLDPDIELISRTGAKRCVDDTATPIVDDAGKVLGAVLVMVDAAERIAAQTREQDLMRKVAKLQAEMEKHEVLGAELEAFGTAASRDLHPPLLVIASLSGLLADKYRERLDASGKQFLDRVRLNARQMNVMLEDYLRFLKSTREQPIHFVPVNVKELAEAVFADLAAEGGRRSSQFTCHALPRAWGDEVMIREVLSDLLDNAFKYSSRREYPVLEVGAMPGRDFHTFFVRDNGVGVDLTLATHLFEPFQRFHNADEFFGTGVGLAIVRRIVKCHGGRIWAESRVDSGATFFFTLPAREPDRQTGEVGMTASSPQ